MKKLTFTLLAAFAVFTAFTLLHKPGINDARWILARWENKDGKGILIEEWTQQSDSIFTGFSCYIMGGDTLFSEKLRLQQRGQELFFISAVKDQNNAKPVEFKLTSHLPKTLIFENPAHDFPQKISYYHPTADSLVAEISGLKNGKYAAQKFLMGKVK